MNLSKIALIFIGILTILVFLRGEQTRFLCGAEINRIDRFLSVISLEEIK